MDIKNPPAIPRLLATVATTSALPDNTYYNGSGGVNATLTANAAGALTVDGYAVNAGDTVLVKNEATSANNGLYDVLNPGSGSAPYVLVRDPQMDTADQFLNGVTVPTSEIGSTLANTLWILNSVSPFTVGSSNVPIAEIVGGGGGSLPTPASAGLTLYSNTVPAPAWNQGDFNVLSFGADPTNSTSSLAAFNAAIAAAGATPNTSGTVRIPAGSYMLDGNLVLSGNPINLIGDGPRTELNFTNLDGNPAIHIEGGLISGMSISVGDASGTAIEATANEQEVLSILGVTILGTGTNDYPAILKEGFATYIEDVIITTFALQTGQPALIVLAGIGGSQIRGVQFQNCQATVDSDSALINSSASDFTITECLGLPETGSAFNYGCYINTGGSDRYLVTDNEFSAAATAPVFDGGTGTNKLVNDNPIRSGGGGSVGGDLSGALPDPTVVGIQGNPITNSPGVNETLQIQSATMRAVLVDGGVDDGLFTASDSNMPTGADPFTAIMWVQSTADLDAFLFFWGSGDGQVSIGLNNSSNNNELQIACGSANVVWPFTPDPGWRDGAWRMFAIRYDGTNATALVNGAVISSQAIALAIAGLTGTLSVGGYAVTENAVFARPAILPLITNAQVADLYDAATTGGYDAAVLALSPLGAWKLDETSGATAADYSGNGNDGTYGPGNTLDQPGPVADPLTLEWKAVGQVALWQATTAAASPGAAVDFSMTNSGTNDTGSSTDAGLPSGSSPFTWGILVDSTFDATSYAVAGWGTDTSGDFVLYLQNGQLLALANGGALNHTLGSGNFADGNPHSLIVTYDGTTVTGYMDGAALNAPQTYALAVVLAGAGGYLVGAGGAGFGLTAFTGNMEREFFIGSCLTAEQVHQIYTGGVSLDPTDYDALIATFSPLHYHNMQESSGDFADQGSLNVPLAAGAAGLTYQQPGMLYSADGTPEVAAFDSGFTSLACLMSAQLAYAGVSPGEFVMATVTATQDDSTTLTVMDREPYQDSGSFATVGSVDFAASSTWTAPDEVASSLGSLIKSGHQITQLDVRLKSSLQSGSTATVTMTANGQETA